MSQALRDKAQFYQKLHTGVKAGLTLQQIIDGQLLPASLAGKAAGLKRRVDKGASFADAFKCAGLVAPWEAQLIHIGESSGSLETVCARLDDFFSTKVKQLQYIRGKLVYPVVTVLIAITVLPLPALVAGALTPAAYIVQSAIGIGVVALLYRVLLVVPFRAASIGAFNPLLLKCLDWVGREHFLRLQFEVSYLDLLTLCLDSGMDAVQALTLLQGNFRAKALKRRHAFAISKVDKGGCSLTEALGGQGILRHPTVLSFLAMSEASGTLHSDMREFLERQRQEVSATTDYWIRRASVVVYIGAAAYAAMKVVPLFLQTIAP